MLRLVAGVLAGLAVGGFASPVFAAVSDGMAVAQANACMGCHAVDRKLVGPSFKDVAAKYKGDAAAQAKLEKKVRDGGAGVWGAIPMPSHPGMSAADIHTVVTWVLAGASSK
ncbi:c-type cytochrome [Paraburkholderia lycopersici]|uniref:c-type cytochrome n=1 Tax=Paraburkholderia lycopersici TaxID=416944 RepID=UPI000B874D80|nr:c-type cytochrome [Paraburkholderia lycopersici]